MPNQSLYAMLLPFTEKARLHPFNRALHDGSLPLATFKRYLYHDLHYLKTTSTLIEHALLKNQNAELHNLLTSLYNAMEQSESPVHEEYLSACNTSSFPDRPESFHSQTINDYLKHLTNTAHCNTPVFVASLVPCFHLYATLGASMNHKPLSRDHPYKRWIQTYSGVSFLKANNALSQKIKQLEDLGSQNTALMRQAALNSAKFELEFWDEVIAPLPYSKTQQIAFFDSQSTGLTHAGGTGRPSVNPVGMPEIPPGQNVT